MATKTQANTQARQPTFDINDPAFQKILAEAVAARLAAEKAEMQAAKPKNDQSSKNAWAAQKAFIKAGYKDAKPGENILTFNRWVALGLRPKEGEKAKKVNNLRLFHRDQCRPLTKEEAAGFKAKAEEKAAKASARVVPISTGASL